MIVMLLLLEATAKEKASQTTCEIKEAPPQKNEIEIKTTGQYATNQTSIQNINYYDEDKKNICV
jgi:hypothetical protein